MTPLREKLIHWMEYRDYSPGTIRSFVFRPIYRISYPTFQIMPQENIDDFRISKLAFRLSEPETSFHFFIHF